MAVAVLEGGWCWVGATGGKVGGARWAVLQFRRPPTSVTMSPNYVDQLLAPNFFRPQKLFKNIVFYRSGATWVFWGDNWGHVFGSQLGSRVGITIGRNLGQQVAKIGAEIGAEFGKIWGRIWGRSWGRNWGRIGAEFGPRKRATILGDATEINQM